MANVTRTVRKVQLKTWLGLITATTIGAGDGSTVYWADEPLGWQRDEHLMVTLPQPAQVGRDEIIDEYDDTQAVGSEVRQYQVGQRQTTLSVQIWSFQASGDLDAAAVASRIRNRIQLRDWHQYFDASGLAFARFVLDSAITTSVDERDLTARQLDILFNDNSIEEGAPVGYIKTVEDAEFKAPDESGAVLWTGNLTVG